MNNLFTQACSWLDTPKNSAGCGRKLSMLLSTVCDGKYNGVKRSQPDLIDSKYTAGQVC